MFAWRKACLRGEDGEQLLVSRTVRHTASVRHNAVSAAVRHKRDVLCCADRRDHHRRRDRHDVGVVAHPVQSQSVRTRAVSRTWAQLV